MKRVYIITSWLVKDREVFFPLFFRDIDEGVSYNQYLAELTEAAYYLDLYFERYGDPHCKHVETICVDANGWVYEYDVSAFHHVKPKYECYYCADIENFRRLFNEMRCYYYELPNVIKFKLFKFFTTRELDYCVMFFAGRYGMINKNSFPSPVPGSNFLWQLDVAECMKWDGKYTRVWNKKHIGFDIRTWVNENKQKLSEYQSG